VFDSLLLSRKPQFYNSLQFSLSAFGRIYFWTCRFFLIWNSVFCYSSAWFLQEEYCEFKIWIVGELSVIVICSAFSPNENVIVLIIIIVFGIIFSSFAEISIHSIIFVCVCFLHSNTEREWWKWRPAFECFALCSLILALSLSPFSGAHSRVLLLLFCCSFDGPLYVWCFSPSPLNAAGFWRKGERTGLYYPVSVRHFIFFFFFVCSSSLNIEKRTQEGRASLGFMRKRAGSRADISSPKELFCVSKFQYRRRPLLHLGCRCCCCRRRCIQQTPPKIQSRLWPKYNGDVSRARWERQSFSFSRAHWEKEKCTDATKQTISVKRKASLNESEIEWVEWLCEWLDWSRLSDGKYQNLRQMDNRTVRSLALSLSLSLSLSLFGRDLPIYQNSSSVVCHYYWFPMLRTRTSDRYKSGSECKI